MTRRTLPLILAAPLLLAAASFGGWAIISLDEVPDTVPVGKPVTLGFMVRQHGVDPLEDITPTIEARNGDRTVRATARPTGRRGHYSARLTLPVAGDWNTVIHSGFGRSRLTLVPLQATTAGAAPAPLSTHERGRRLFAAKGCASCHEHSEVPESGMIDMGPELTRLRFEPAYLARFLADPSIKPQTPGRGRMPDLDLSQAEITALVAFVNAERAARR